MKIRDLHNAKACETTLQPADRVAARVMNADRNLAGFTTATVSRAFTADYWQDVQHDMQVGWLHG